MKKDFVPFQSLPADGSSPRTEMRTEVVAGTRAATAFRPLLQAAAPLPALPNGHGEPTVTFERDGDRVTLIKVQCPCGNVFELACEYSKEHSG